MFWQRFPNASYHDDSTFKCYALTALCCFGLCGYYHTLITHAANAIDL